MTTQKLPSLARTGPLDPPRDCDRKRLKPASPSAARCNSSSSPIMRAASLTLTLALSLGSTAPALGASSDPILASTSADGVKGSGQSYRPDISADGRFVAFLSSANNLLAGTHSGMDALVKDLSTGEVFLVSRHSDGTPANGGSSPVITISSTGRYVVFQSGASNLVDDDTNSRSDMFWHDVETGETRVVNLATDGTWSSTTAEFGAVSGDGRYVAFRSTASNLVPNDTNNTYDVFLRDMIDGTTKRISLTASGAQSASGGGEPDISSDGRYVIFKRGGAEVWRVDTLNCEEGISCAVTRVNVNNSNQPVAGHTSVLFPKISGSGRFVTWESNAPYVSGDLNARADVFVRDVTQGTTTRVSIATGGTEASGDSLTPDISDDGRYVTFTSSAPDLVTGDTNAKLDLFVHDRVDATTRRVSLTSAGGEINDHAQYYARVSGGGSGVVMTTNATNVIASDTDSTEDVYVYSIGPLNTLPIADAGIDRAAAVGEEVVLNGAASNDTETPPYLLAYEWTISTSPEGSQAELRDAGTSSPILVPDLPGEYRMQLIVTDEEGSSSLPDEVSVIAEIDPAFVFSRLSSGSVRYEYTNNRSAGSYDYVSPTSFNEGLVAGEHYVSHYDYDYNTWNYQGSYDQALVSLNEQGETRIVGRGDTLANTDRIFEWAYSPAVNDDGSITFWATTSSPTTGWKYGPFESRNGQVTETTLTPPVTVIGEPEPLTSVWNYGWYGYDQSLLWGSKGSCTNVTRNGYTYCYWHHGIYRRAADGVRRIADTDTLVPGSSATFIGFGEADLGEGGNAVFAGYWLEPDAANWTWRYGIFVAQPDGAIQKIADSGDSASMFHKGWFGRPQLDDGRVLVGGCQQQAKQSYSYYYWECGIYSIDGGVVTAEVTNRNAPAGGRYFGWNWVDTWNFDFEDGILDFTASGYGPQGWFQGVFWKENGRVREVVGSGATIDARTYENTWLPSRDSLDGRSVLFMGYVPIEHHWDYDPNSGEYSYRHEYGHDTLVARFDSDRDARGDDLDNCPLRPNPDQLDIDGNGIGDVCEDSDLDSILDPDDNCPFLTNAEQIDLDGDRLGDACDVCPVDVDPDQTDRDQDGNGDACDDDSDNDTYADDLDNCPLLPNDQADLDLDGEGDGCDSDLDGDGIDNVVDGRIDGSTYIDESAIASTSFSDQNLGGRSFGKIAGKGQLILQVSDSPNAEGGLLVAAPSGQGQARIKQCAFSGKDAQVSIDQGSIVEITCGSIHVQPFVNRAAILLDDDVVIDVPQNSAAIVQDSGTEEFLVENQVESVFPIEMSLGDDVKVTLPSDSAGIVSSPADGFYVIEADESSSQPLLVEKDGELQTVRPGSGFTSQYAFSGFLAPVNDPPTINTTKAGSAIPVKFSLGGSEGLGIFVAGSPSSQLVACESGAQMDAIEETVTSGGSMLSYDAGSDAYTYVWKTGKSWSGCRRLTLKFVDGQEFSAIFRFAK